MITIDDLKIIAQKHTSDGNEDATLFIDVKALGIIFRYFGEDDKRRVIRLVVQDKEVGYIRREDLYDFIAIAEKGIGDSDYAVLPGDIDPSIFPVFEYHCPVDGCGKCYLSIHEQIFKCPIHQEKVMVLKT